jgi:hypothetical protein
MLMGDPRVDPSADDNHAIRLSSEYGHIEVVKLLMGDPRVDPSADDNHAIRLASENGHIEVVNLLLADRRVDPSAGQQYALVKACGGGHNGVIELLLSHSKTVLTRKALVAADACDHKSVVCTLLEKDTGLVLRLFVCEIACKPNGVLINELRQWEKRSALTFLLALGRRDRKFRVSDVLRYVVEEFARFENIAVAAEPLED